MQGINCASRDSPRLFPQVQRSVAPSTTKRNDIPCEVPISFSQGPNKTKGMRGSEETIATSDWFINAKPSSKSGGRSEAEGGFELKKSAYSFGFRAIIIFDIIRLDIDKTDTNEHKKKQDLCSSCVCNIHVRQGGTLCRAWGYHMAIKLEGDKRHGANICRVTPLLAR
ncbi:hypothetical protein V1478_003053 [Vespula squamosa]|uniref:Uncharacterized protein n=1 Tax=Vespula squamosa TaxID=30214 RepID=A0ABD2BRK8_VESSQ